MEDVALYLRTEAGSAALQNKLAQFSKLCNEMESPDLDSAVVQLSHEMILYLRDESELRVETMMQFKQLIVFLCDTVSTSMKAVRLGLSVDDNGDPSIEGAAGHDEEGDVEEDTDSDENELDFEHDNEEDNTQFQKLLFMFSGTKGSFDGFEE